MNIINDVTKRILEKVAQYDNLDWAADPGYEGVKGGVYSNETTVQNNTDPKKNRGSRVTRSSYISDLLHKVR